METTTIVIGVEVGIGLILAVVGGAFGIYKASANAHAEIRATLATHTEKFNTHTEKFNTVHEKMNCIDGKIDEIKAGLNSR